LGCSQTLNAKPSLPQLWLGHSTDTRATIANYSCFKNTASLFSFGDVIRRPELSDKFVGSVGANMGFTGPVMLDSGGFTVSKYPECNWSSDDLARAFERAEADVLVSLDFPPWRRDASRTRLNKLVQTAISYAHLRSRRFTSPLMPVIHGRTLPEIKFSCELT
jgi:queuine/archaeosine tRNA-ribosyltransferase